MDEETRAKLTQAFKELSLEELVNERLVVAAERWVANRRCSPVDAEDPDMDSVVVAGNEIEARWCADDKIAQTAILSPFSYAFEAAGTEADSVSWRLGAIALVRAGMKLDKNRPAP